ncbi:MAG: hypothetical protein NVSMB1_14230 [Polyangiales bacterium]
MNASFPATAQPMWPLVRKGPRARMTFIRAKTVVIATFSMISGGGLFGCGDNQTHPDRPDRPAADAQPLGCVPNLDGRIDSAELAPTLGIAVSYLISPANKERTIDLVGRNESGRRLWDFSLDYADDQRWAITASTVVGKWYAASFPTGQFVAPFDVAGELEGIYRHDTQALFLIGLASVQPSPKEGKTLLVYADPIPLFKFPLAVGSRWVATSMVSNATVRGLPYAGKDTYEIEDDAVGRLVLHDLTFEQVHRVRTRVTVAPALGPTLKKWQVSFLFECFGEVLRASSRPEEPNPDFTTAAGLRRIGQ